MNTEVCIVGIVLSSESKGNCMDLLLHDGTGAISAKQWLVNSADLCSF